MRPMQEFHMPSSRSSARHRILRRIARPVAMALAAGSLAVLAGCVVAPVAPVPGPYAVPPGVAYVAPTYPMPAVGFVWEYHPRYGWGWHHPVYGWHRGWR
jgi:hypothetical protein